MAISNLVSQTMTPDALTERLTEALGDRLVSVVLYGSAAVGERSEKYSDFNVLVVCDRLGIEELNLIGPLTQEWAQCGNPPPLLFTRERLLESSDVFPIELLDIKEGHRMLYGEDVVRELPISQQNLRFQLEHELKGKLIQLRESYLLTATKEPEIADLMIHSLSPFQVLFRAALRFFEINVPRRKRHAVRSLGKHVNYDVSIFDTIADLRDGIISSEELDISDCFNRYLQCIEQTADLINNLDRSGN